LLGLPDDGYDYSQHLRFSGKGVFMQALEVPQPEPDVVLEVSREGSGERDGRGGEKHTESVAGCEETGERRRREHYRGIEMVSDKDPRVGLLHAAERCVHLDAGWLLPLLLSRLETEILSGQARMFGTPTTSTLASHIPAPPRMQ
jgi:hypothetical protein